MGVGGSIGDLQSHNAYAYTRNNPVNRIDPAGMNDCEEHADCENIALGLGDFGQPGQDILGALNFGPGNPGNGCNFSDITNCAASESDREIRQAILAENHFGFTAANALFQSIADYYQAIADENAYFQSAAYKAAIEAQKQALAKAIAANSGGTISYQDAYDSLTTAGGYLKGGNYNFVSQYYDAGDLSCGADASRCSGIHFSGQDANGNFYVHLDTANPFTGPGGLLEHGFVDVFLGNVAYYVIPRPWP
jgi:hypothetical protein